MRPWASLFYLQPTHQYSIIYYPIQDFLVSFEPCLKTVEELN